MRLNSFGKLGIGASFGGPSSGRALRWAEGLRLLAHRHAETGLRLLPGPGVHVVQR
jgi:hypothetical protein